MLKLVHVKSAVNWAPGKFKLLFCMLCYNYYFSNNVMLVDGINLPSYANVKSSWNLTISSANILTSPRNYSYPSFTLGWIISETYKLAIFYRDPNDINPIFVWSTNLDQNIQFVNGANLELTLDGDLVLMDAESGSYVWSTNTSGLLVESMHLRDDGNLVLLNRKGESVWESYRHPSGSLTDKLFNVKQGPSIGQRLTTSALLFNSTGNYYVEWDIDGFHGYVDFANEPQEYEFWDYEMYNSTVRQYQQSDFEKGIGFSFLFLDVNGHLNWVQWRNNSNNIIDFWNEGDCSYPTACGEYGVCLDTGCSCPTGKEGSLNYFKPLNPSDDSLGCTLFTPISCSGNSKHHSFLELEQVTYFNSTPSLVGTDVDSCKRACLEQCSCKAVFFHYYVDPSLGNCTLPSQIFTLMDVTNGNLGHKVVTFLKVQNNALTKSSERKIVIYVSTSISFLVFATGAICFVLIRMKSTSKDNDFSLDILIDTVGRFSIESLKFATQNFQTKLGQGGFGSVYEGIMVDGTKIAVKSLESCRQGTKEFLAEVNTIGSIHHFNLVRLIGFCDEGFNRLLVYEYMCNGSLDKWIFNSGVHETLTWSIRRRIIEGVAAGLEYLHEHCQKNVIHFDIKPQNILLDKDFNVKISDFGLAKMVDREESQVMTVVRGTPGYMAPELINSRAISVKVDVYSLGVVILEIVCGRRNFGSSEEDILANLVKAKADQDQLSDLIDVRIVEFQHREEAVNMMKIGIWWLQPHFIRPTMSKVVKALQDLSDNETLNNLSDLTMAIETTAVEGTYYSSFCPADLLLSEPR